MSEDKTNPSSALRWQNAVKKEKALAGIEPADIRLSHLAQIPKKSASKFTLAHFLCLRVLWKEQTSDFFRISDYIDSSATSHAKERVATTKCQEFFSNIGRTQPGSRMPPYAEDSIFTMVRLYMNMVFRLDGAAATSGFPKVLMLAQDPTAAPGSYRGSTPESPTARKGPGLGADFDMEEGSDRMDISPVGSFNTRSSFSSDSPIKPDGSSPARASEFGPTDDEMIINMALVLLLNALTEPDVTFEQIRSKVYRWLPCRDILRILKSTNAVQGSSASPPNQHFEARTDGSLRFIKQDLPAALLEVKPHLRSSKREQIQWQEGAQMAAYIYTLLFSKPPPFDDFGLLKCNKPGFKRRLLLSQDHSEIYITIAEYDAEYERYLGLHHPSSSTTAAAAAPPHPSASSSRNSGFLFMDSYGPWRVNSENDMRDVCAHLVTLSMHLASQTKPT